MSTKYADMIMATSSLPKRVLVYLMHDANSPAKQVDFAQSIVDVFAPTEDVVNVYVEMARDRLLISKSVPLPSDAPTLVRMKRPSFCPIHCMSAAEKAALGSQVTGCGVNVGAVAVVESCDGMLLLTRRAKHLRTYPNIWVPPGGHVEVDETLPGAALRELEEETGLRLCADDCEEGKTVPLAVWESTFPPRLSLGSPIRHHVVAYVLVRLRAPLTARLLTDRLRLDPAEVSAATWLQRRQARAIVAVSEEASAEGEVDGGLPECFSACVVDAAGKHRTAALRTEVLLRRCGKEDGGGGEARERVSTGTKFALEEWLRLGSASS